MGLAQTYSAMETHTQGNIKMGSQMGRGSIPGRMGQSMWESLRMD